MASILLIDDEPQVRSALRRVLERSGHSVLEARDGGEGLRIASGNPVDLVITDIIMPGMDGIELIIEFSERHPGVPVIAMSGGGKALPSDLVLSDAFGLGAVTSLRKPFDMSQLREVVDAALTSHRRNRRA